MVLRASAALLFLPIATAQGPASLRSASATAPTPTYTIAFASFAPLNTDIFIANADGSSAQPFLSSPALDYNASFSPDGKWIVFTSERGGSADIYRAHLDGTGLKKLTNDPAFDDQGAISPDGKSLAFVSSRNGQADIWVMDIASKAVRNITNNPAGDFRPSWSPDGKWIAFTSDRESTKPHFGFTLLHSAELYLIQPDGSGLRRVTRHNAFVGSPSWSADGKRLLFYTATMDEVNKIKSPQRLRATTQIAKIDLATNVERELTSGPGEKWSPHLLADGRVGYVSGGPDGGIEFTTGPRGTRDDARAPNWSPDGKRMVFHADVGIGWPPMHAALSRNANFRLVRTGIFPSYSPTGDSLVMNDGTAGILHNNVMVMSARGAGQRYIYSDPKRNSLAPAWSPKGDLIAFGVGGFFQAIKGAAHADIAVIRPDGTGLRVLTDGSGNFGLPSWSPDGTRIVYRASSPEHNGISIVDVATGKVTNINTRASHENFPTWSPAGDRIAFVSDRDGDYEIYTVRPDGSDLKRVTHMPGNDAHCTWSPDGKWIAFASQRGGFRDEAPLHPYNAQPYGEIYVVRDDGSETIMLTDNQFEDGTPNWKPLSKVR